MKSWIAAGLLATLIIIISLPLYLLHQAARPQPDKGPQRAVFAGSVKCEPCHKRAYQQWHKSDHAMAMAVADERTVLGDFNNRIFVKDGVKSRFYRKDGKFFVHTRGPNGVMGDFQITHTFGWKPLQQYLVPFPGGRMQCLPIAWDVKKKKWFHLYPDMNIQPDEWICWTNPGQNWNSMCADCHSTYLRKNYDPADNSYNTKWAEISVGCEACHGPGSKHLAWAKLPVAARPDHDNGLVVHTGGMDNRQQVELCAPCHSRRSMLGDYEYMRPDLLNTEVPRLLEQGLYFPDGQIQGEVYVYGSFVQSKMYANGVRCSNCHNIHSLKRHMEGNRLCLQCHEAAVYDTATHHFHKKKGEAGKPILSASGKVLFEVGTGAQCVQCHMPGRFYMVNDYRPDHSIRIPRPDLSIVLDVPNACNRCHVDKDSAWSAAYTKKWYGEKQKYTFGPTFSAARKGEKNAAPDLIRIAGDPLSPPLVRATAISLLGRQQDAMPVFRNALLDEEAIIRWSALVNMPERPLEELVKLAGPLLDDPVKAVRIEAARRLTAVPADRLPARYAGLYASALSEFHSTMRYLSDFPQSLLNLGSVAMQQGDLKASEHYFQEAIRIDPDFYAARLNLAVLYSRQGRNEAAEKVLRPALERNPDLADVNYSLGLLLSEERKYDEAVLHLTRAADAMPNNARVHYNLGQLEAFLHRDSEAEQALWKAADNDPDNIRYLQALAEFYLNRRRFHDLKKVADRMIRVAPDNVTARQFLDIAGKQQNQALDQF